MLKPQTVWLVIPGLVVARSWRYLAGFLLATAAWIAVSVVIAGPASLIAMVHLLATEHVGLTQDTVRIPSLVSALLASAGAGFLVAAFLGALTALLLVKGRWLRGRPIAVVALGVPLSLLCSPHVWMQDLLLLTPTLVLIARRWPVPAAGAALTLSVVAWLEQGHVRAGARHLQPVLLGVVVVIAVAAFRAGRLPGIEGDDVSLAPSSAAQPPAGVPAGAVDPAAAAP